MSHSHGSTASTGSEASTSQTEMMGMESMHMTFFNNMTTSLYSRMWTPTNVGQYAATCVFLVVLGVVFRGLLAAKAWKESSWLDEEFNRRYVAVQGKGPMSERIQTNLESKRMTLSENGIEENVMVVKKKGVAIRPWRLSVDPLRAVMDTAVAGVGYLL